MPEGDNLLVDDVRAVFSPVDSVECSDGPVALGYQPGVDRARAGRLSGKSTSCRTP
jgi:hypothetical protein